MGNDQVLERIDAKLGALLSLTVDRYLRETGIARPKTRSIDRMLVDAGLGATDVAALLGKTERAVYKLLQEKQERAGGRQVASGGRKSALAREKRGRSGKEAS